MVADRTKKGLNRWTPLSLGAFWVQIHNVSVLNITQEVAEYIGGLLGTARKVDKSRSRDYIGRFLLLKVRFNVREPFMHETLVTFPNDGRVWVNFKYEALPKYCLICEMLGHITRICKDPHEDGKLEGENSGDMDEG
ncbi:hypothetical protein TB1_046056 [Malus domestica]